MMDLMNQFNRMDQLSLYHGCRVLYNGYKTEKDGSTVESVCTGTVIGWDEHTIYTDFKFAGVSGGECYYYEPEIITQEMVWTDFRIGFHRSRLIKIIEEVKITVNNNLKQAELF
jgi:hypothetical protein